MEMIGPTAFIPFCIEYEMEKGTKIVLMNTRTKRKVPIPRTGIQNLASQS
jgi:hypothetical protein